MKSDVPTVTEKSQQIELATGAHFGRVKMPDSLGRDKKSENTRNEKGRCFVKQCPNKPAVDITHFGRKVKVCKGHKYLDGVK